jgi:hypothetical protein
MQLHTETDDPATPGNECKIIDFAKFIWLYFLLCSECANSQVLQKNYYFFHSHVFIGYETTTNIYWLIFETIHMLPDSKLLITSICYNINFICHYEYLLQETCTV